MRMAIIYYLKGNMKKIFNTIISLVLLLTLVILPQTSHAQLTNIAGNFGTCALTGFANDLFQDLLGGLGNLGNLTDFLGLAGGLAGGLGGGGGGGNEVPVHDAASISELENILSTNQDILTIDIDILDIQASLQFKEYVLDCMVWAITQGIIEEVTGSTIGWVNTGYGGDPFYIADPDVFFASLEDQVARDFFSAKLDPSPIPSNYKDLVIDSLSQTRRRVDINELLDCPYGNDVDSLFSDSDAEAGWNNYLNVMSNPACTPLGSYAIAHNELVRETASVRGEAQLYLSDPGFLPELESGQVITPGSVIEEQLQSLIDSGVTQLEDADELSELLGVLGQLVANLLSDNTSLRELDTSLFTGSSLQEGGTFIPAPPDPPLPPPPPIDPGDDPGPGSLSGDPRIDALNSLVGRVQLIISQDTDMTASERNWTLAYVAEAREGVSNLDYALSINDITFINLALEKLESALGWAEYAYANPSSSWVGPSDAAQLFDLTENQIRPVWTEIRDEFGLSLIWNVNS